MCVRILEKMEPVTVARTDNGIHTTKKHQQRHQSLGDDGTIFLYSDHGHRYGNFANYSTFHPPQARLQVLESTGILHYIRRGLVQQQQHLRSEGQSEGVVAGGLQMKSKNINNDDDDDDSYDSDDKKRKNIYKRMRMNNAEEVDSSSSSVLLKSALNQCGNIYYCDLGCNSGELTKAVALSLLIDSTTHAKKEEEEEEEEHSIVVHVLGVDIDPKLVQRANTNFAATFSSSLVSGGKFRNSSIQNNTPPVPDKDCRTNIHANYDIDTANDVEGQCKGDGVKRMTATTTTSSTGTNARIESTFMVCDLNSDLEHNTVCAFFANVSGSGVVEDTTGSCGGGVIAHNDKKHQPVVAASPTISTPTLNQPPCRRFFHLTTIFSTTMWIHVHGGDDGLKSFLERACDWTSKFLLVEPQPSGW